MCKNRGSHSQTPAENNNVNVGLMNLSSENMNSLSMEVILQYLIAFIAILMFFRWMKKCWTRRQERQKRMLGIAGINMNNLNQGLNNQGQGQLALPAPPAPSAPAAPPAPQHVPMPIIVHHASGSNYKPVEFVDKMEKYRTD